MKRLLSMILVATMLFTLTTPAFAASTTTVDAMEATTLAEPKSAGLAWGPFNIGNIELKVVKPHMGSVGPYGRIEHINFEIRNTETRQMIANYHIFKALFENGQECFIVWDSVTQATVFRHCDSNNWTNAVTEFVDLVIDALSEVLSQADLLATIAIGAVIVVVLIDLIIPMDPVPILPFRTQAA